MKRISFIRYTFFLFCLGAIQLSSIGAIAGPIEVSLGGSYNQSNYSENSYAWQRKWGASIGYFFSEMTEIELGYQDVFDRTNIQGYGNTSFHDVIFSANISQTFAPKTWPVQPFGKVGFGQLNREASGSYASGASPPAIVDSLTGILGIGCRVYLTKTFGIKSEATSYLTGGAIATWKDNIAITFGVSAYF